MTGAPVARLDPERPHRVRTPFPSGESYADVVERTRSFLADLAHRQPSDARVVIVDHSATKWALDFLILGVPLETSVAVPFGWQPGWAYVFA
jgi:broad specificity phosphatase PhoE